METGSIEAVLRLGYKDFESDINHVISLVEKLETTLSSLGKSNAPQGLSAFKTILDETIGKLGQFSKLSNETSNFNKFANGLNKTANAMQLLSNTTNLSKTQLQTFDHIIDKIAKSVVETYKEIQKLATGESELGNSFSNLMNIIQLTIRDFDTLKNKVTEIESKLKNTSSSTDKFDNEVKQSTNDLSNFGKQLQDANTKLSSIDSSTKRTAKSLGYFGTALRTAFSNVFNRVTSGISQSITDTYKLKSEMTSWLDMLNYSPSQQADFNKQLDETVKKYQRINKYSLGETVGNIAVEFDATPKQISKMMDVSSMITNEYVRAGRSAEEAGLALKDILQEQFQRLSRETGVNASMLQEKYGYEEGNLDSLLDALQKAGEDRNWDEIAQKASSINDIITITENRISEGVTDLIDRFTPAITSAFNTILPLFNLLSDGVNNGLDWLEGNGWEQFTVKIGAVGSALFTVISVLSRYRTGLTLAQASQSGLIGSISALVFGLKGEAVAELGTTKAILQKITGIKSETVANMSSKQMIASKLLALDAEKVAELGVKGAIAEAIGVKESAVAVEKAEQIQEELNTLAIEKNALQRGLSTGIIDQEIFSKKMSKIAETEDTLSKELNTGATLANAGAMEILNAVFYASPAGWLALGILALAGAFYVLTGGLSDTWDKMKSFNETMQDTESAYKKGSDYLEQVKKDKGEESDAYKEAKQAVEEYNEELRHSSYWYKHSQTAYESMGIGGKTVSSDVLKKNGLDTKSVQEYNNNISDLIYGGNKFYEAEQVLNKQYLDENSNFAKNLDENIKVMQNANMSEDEILQNSAKLQGNYQSLAKHSYDANTSEDWWGWLSNSFLAGVDQFWIDWDNFWLNPDWEGLINGTIGRIASLFGVDNLGKMITDWIGGISDSIKGKTLMELLGLDENKDYVGDFFKWLGGGSYFQISFKGRSGES